MEKNLVLDGPYTNKDFFNFLTTSELPRHNWYYFKEGFSVGLVKEALNSTSSNKSLRILDPFNGSGTTILTSSLLKHHAVGIEVNPFLESTTRVKTNSTVIKPLDFNHLRDKIIKNSRGGAYSPLEGFSTFTPKEGLDKWLFNTSVIRRFQATLESIELHVDKEYKEMFRFAATISCINCGNTRKDGKGLRYIKDWQGLAFSSKHFEDHFKKLLNIIKLDTDILPIEPSFAPKVYLSDSRKLLADVSFPEDEFDLVVTSPPYMNSFDYTDIYRAELFLGGFVKNFDELKKLRHQTLRSHVQIEWNKDIFYESPYLLPYFNKVAENKANLWNQNIPLMIKAYFDDMAKVLTSIKPRLKERGKIWLVVSTSAYGGVHIPVDLLIGELGHEFGYKLRGIHCLRQLRTSSQQYAQLNTKKAPLRESLIILEKQ